MSARLVVDLSNKSATVLDHAGRVQLIWSGVTRRTAVELARVAGWQQAGQWTLTSPPDGFWCPLMRNGRVMN